MDAKGLAQAHAAAKDNPDDSELKTVFELELKLAASKLVEEQGDDFVGKSMMLPGVIKLWAVEKATRELFEEELAKKVTGEILGLLQEKGHMLATAAG